ncbi:MAG: DNA-3-methyladenine glycosylase 2 family protein [Thaumarchaeota archaeon]|nr:DNA-3-methyladenine glycosylase 2 family protein [Nitrososphaerota archaeon]
MQTTQPDGPIYNGYPFTVGKMGSEDSLSFPNIGEPQTFRSGVEHVSKVDPKIARLTSERGLIEFRAGGDPFESLVEAIISQQLNGRVARTIFEKLKQLMHSKPIDPFVLNAVPSSKLRKVGVSPQKIRYLKDLSSRVVGGRLDLRGLKNKPDDQVVQILDEVKGIGPWTAQMFLLFTLGRPDVLPVDDLGIQVSVRRVYSLRKLPRPDKIRKIAKDWHPFCSVAALYLWQAKEAR